ncbi:MAG TPA: Hpt domain-containing protein, partial [Burkholderiaceae bacterium]|nr:Hpt domain-containing protein [Burkholderiaceae bacterium]HNG80040.1 Hpt domain-containing protein [Burkholderiaceae bacterium]
MRNDSSDDDLIADMLPAFIEEANEQVAAFEQLLLELEDAPDDHERLDALFRCAHTVKGSAGLFGLNRVVEFTHHVETLLDRLRDGLLQLTPGLSTLLLQSNDTIRELVATAQQPDDPAARSARQALVQQLQQASGPTPTRAAPTPPASAATATAAPEATSRCWQLTVRFSRDIFRNGMDPLAILHYLRELGDIGALRCDRSLLPELEALDPESCHLALSFELVTRAERERIEHAFEFVREDCDLTLTALDGAPPAPASPVGPGRDATQRDTGETAEAGAALQAAVAELQAMVRPAAAHTPARSREGASAPGGGAGDEGGFIRVHANRLDEVINLLGELVIAGAGASQLARQTRQRGLIEANQRISRLIESIRNSTLKLRMVPIGDTFARFRRVVRDTAAELGKDVALEIVGADTELDKAVVERIADPLMHLVRNAL